MDVVAEWVAALGLTMMTAAMLYGSLAGTLQDRERKRERERQHQHK